MSNEQERSSDETAKRFLIAVAVKVSIVIGLGTGVALWYLGTI